MVSILMIDDDVQFCELTSRYLSIEGFNVEVRHDHLSGIKALKNQIFDVILLDVMIPDSSGFSILSEIRGFSTVPIIMYSALGEEVNKIIGLESGADSYVKKDSQPRVLTAEINSILRRTQAEFKTKKRDAIINVENIELNRTKRLVHKNGEQIKLTVAEFNILEYLMTHLGEAKSKKDISLEALGKKITAYDRSVDTHISRLRAKIGKNTNDAAMIITVQGFGYTINRNDKI